eukprot:SAG25_NODE_202_length_11981_cov_16.926612_8_plen_360_part_00
MGGELVGCDHCISSFCKECITRNVGKRALNAVLQNESWHCYMCKPDDVAKCKWKPPKGFSKPPPAKTTSKGPSKTSSKAAAKAAPKPEPEDEPEDEPEVGTAEVEGAADAELTAAEAERMKVAELKSELTSRGLATTGKKATLLKRLLAAIADGSPPPAAAPAPPAAAAAPAPAPDPSPRRLKSTPKREAIRSEPDEEEAAAATAVAEMLDCPIGGQDTLEIDGRPSMQISPSQVGLAIAAHQPRAANAANAAKACAPQSASRGRSAPQNKRKLGALMSELDGEVESRCQLMLNNARSLRDTLRTMFKTQLARLPKKARNMPLREFAESYGVGVDVHIMGVIRAKLEAEGWSEPQVRYE